MSAPRESLGLRSWIEPELARRLSDMIRATGAQIVLASDWRRGRELPHLRDELRAAGVEGTLIGVTGVLDGQPRWREIEAWMTEHGVGAEDVVIVDDGYDMGELAARFVRVTPLDGLDAGAADAIVTLFTSRGGERT
ncbi:MAG TPA: HAD domain-containing protein [Kofleriaceae bacterium]